MRSNSWWAWRFSILSSAFALLAGCANHRAAECTVGTVENGKCVASNARSTYGLVEAAHGADSARIGLALSGGGSKSEPFEMGVLQGLQESGLLAHVDMISTVSGGSYAALYYYSRLYAAYSRVRDRFTTAQNALTDSDQFFNDCFPSEQMRWFGSDRPPDWSANTPGGACPQGESVGAYWPIAAGDYGEDPLRAASHIRGYQDVLSTDFSYANNVDSSVEVRKTIGGATELLFKNSLLLFVPNYIANSLFDWRVSLSPSKNTYDAGITRTYARDAILLAKHGDATPNRPPGYPESPGRLSFAALRELSEATRPGQCGDDLSKLNLCHVPFWIINATAGTGVTNLRLFDSSRYSAVVNGFEFTPYGYGAGAYGWFAWGQRELEPDVPVPEAVGMSAAFFDSQQRTVGSGFLRPTLNLLLHVLNLDWGTSIANYNQTRTEFDGRKIAHNLLPWPLYSFHHNRGNRKSLYIHLSDGGMSENLGAYALIKRGVKDIIIADAATDEKYQFNDLCELGRQLQDEKQFVLVMDLWTPSHVEWSQSNCGKGNDPFGVKGHLPTVVIRGRICPASDAKCTDSGAPSRLYVLKPALNYAASPKSGASLQQELDAAAKHQLEYSTCGSVNLSYPCEVITYLSNPAVRDFPQDSVVGITFNTNAFIYGAYKELGRYYAAHLSLTASHANSPPIEVSSDWTPP
jgi:Patatin-like phospholipase